PNTFPRNGRFGEFDVRRVTFAVEPGPDSKNQLVLRQNPLLMEPTADEMEHPLILAKDVTQFSVEFNDPRTGEWVTEWPATNQLPKMVIIKLGLGRREGYNAGPKDQLVRTVVMAA